MLSQQISLLGTVSPDLPQVGRVGQQKTRMYARIREPGSGHDRDTVHTPPFFTVPPGPKLRKQRCRYRHLGFAGYSSTHFCCPMGHVLRGPYYVCSTGVALLCEKRVRIFLEGIWGGTATDPYAGGAPPLRLARPTAPTEPSTPSPTCYGPPTPTASALDPLVCFDQVAAAGREGERRPSDHLHALACAGGGQCRAARPVGQPEPQRRGRQHLPASAAPVGCAGDLDRDQGRLPGWHLASVPGQQQAIGPAPEVSGNRTLSRLCISIHPALGLGMTSDSNGGGISHIQIVYPPESAIAAPPQPIP